MRTAQETRLELLAAVSQLSQLRPEWRLGQTLANLATTAGRMDPGGVWDLEDEEAWEAAQTLIEQRTGCDSADIGTGIATDDSRDFA